MVRLSISVRPRNGYAFPHKICTIVVDSSERLEDLVSKLKLDKRGLALYLDGTELPLNSSFASHNVRSGDILETCSSPLLSAVLSATLNDLNQVQKLPEEQRTPRQVQQLLDKVNLDPWPNRWSFDDVKRRITCLATMKKVLQRMDRYSHLDVPYCADLHQLYAFMQTVWSRNGNNSNWRNNMAQCFKPTATNRDGKPTICWELLQQKLDKVLQIAQSLQENDLIEAFVESECKRHNETDGGPQNESSRTTSTSTLPAQQQRPRRTLPTLSSHHDDAVMCGTCKIVRADCTCLDGDSCPFYKQLACAGCFSANHPLLHRNHERVPLTDARAKAVVKTKKQYIPQYASGAFACLCALAEAMEQNVLSLSETRLKELAQPLCRSNLYDRQARGQNAFACMENMTEKGLVRKEIITGRPAEQEAKYSLLPAGEKMAKCCLVFERCIQEVVWNRNMANDRNSVLGPTSVADATKVCLIVDTREDATFAERLENRAKSSRIQCAKRELPAGDYIFTVSLNGSERVLPLVIERKSWSDLADSVSGKGLRRLDCVRIDGASGECDHQRCQLCRMKQSGCPTVMFIVEGARCLSRDGEEKCSTNKRCKYCRELSERHGPGLCHYSLEQVLYRLQAEHNCLIHFTRSYNETIDSLFIIREILAAIHPLNVDKDTARAIALSLGKKPDESVGSDVPSLTYQQFCANARMRSSNDVTKIQRVNGNIVEWSDDTFVRNVHHGTAGDAFTRAFVSNGAVEAPGGIGISSTIADVEDFSVSNAVKKAATNQVVNLESDDDEEDLIVINESQESIQILEDSGWVSSKAKGATTKTACGGDFGSSDSEDEIICESQESVQFLRSVHAPSTQESENENDDRSNEVFLDEPPQKRRRTDVPSAPRDLVARSDVTILLIAGLYEYDREYCEDTNNVWQMIYKEHANKIVPLAASANSSRQDFQFYASEAACSLQQDELPLVQRNVTLFWILYSQLRYNILVHVLRQTSCGEELRMRWNARGATKNQHSAGHFDASPVTTHTSPDCLICCETLGYLDTEAMACGHRFHTRCLQEHTCRVKMKVCPMCKFQIEGGPLEGQSTQEAAFTTPHERAAPSASTFSPLGRPPQHSELSLREARLRRFGASGPVASTNSPAQSSATDRGTWTCTQCTVLNVAQRTSCHLCQSPRIFDVATRPSSASRAPTAASATKTHAVNDTSKWSCEQCTLMNDGNAPSCCVCGARNPFRLTERVSDKKLPALIPPVAVDAPTPGASKQKCGACGLQGHNRGSATAQNCPAYNSEEEVKRREKKREAEQRKLRQINEQRQQAARHMDTYQQRIQNMEREMVELRNVAASSEAFTQNELKRLEKAKKRAEKQLEKLG